MKKISQWILFASFVILMAGCAHLKPEVEYLITEYPTPDKIGIYHKVNQGETIWRIAKTYDISIQDIVRSNNIPNVAQVEENQLIFIPGAAAVKEIIVETEDGQKDFVWPLKGRIINYFNEYSESSFSKGIDIRAAEGDTVQAARTGQVVFADYLSGYGYTVILDHQDGFHTVYARNAKLLVKLGDHVLKKTPIAQIGVTRNLAYLHFQVRKDSVEDNPLFYLP